MSSDNRFSDKAFMQFIDISGKKGWVKDSKAKNWKAAVVQLLSILDDNEKSDLRGLDIDHIVERYGNLNRGVAGASLKIYKSRFKGAHSDFVSWAQDPVNYKPSGKASTSSNNDSKSKQSTATSRKTIDPRISADHKSGTSISRVTTDSVVFPIPISGGRIITINNLPHELSKKDAEKISAVVRALAVTEPKE